MKNARLFNCILVVFITMFFIAASHAGAEGIKERMKSRLPEIVALKASGTVGENNRGFLDFVGGVREKEAVVQAENSDRQQVYNAIAKQQGTTPDVVGMRRAKQIADKSSPGSFVQAGDGSWIKK